MERYSLVTLIKLKWERFLILTIQQDDTSQVCLPKNKLHFLILYVKPTYSHEHRESTQTSTGQWISTEDPLAVRLTTAVPWKAKIVVHHSTELHLRPANLFSICFTPQIFRLYLQIKMKKTYVNKLQAFCNPCTEIITAVHSRLFCQTSVLVIFYIYLVENPTSYPAAKMNSHKSTLSILKMDQLIMTPSQERQDKSWMTKHACELIS